MVRKRSGVTTREFGTWLKVPERTATTVPVTAMTEPCRAVPPGRPVSSAPRLSLTATAIAATESRYRAFSMVPPPRPYRCGLPKMRCKPVTVTGPMYCILHLTIMSEPLNFGLVDWATKTVNWRNRICVRWLVERRGYTGVSLVADNRYYHVTAVQADGEVRMYVDGQLERTRHAEHVHLHRSRLGYRRSR